MTTIDYKKADFREGSTVIQGYSVVKQATNYRNYLQIRLIELPLFRVHYHDLYPL